MQAHELEPNQEQGPSAETVQARLEEYQARVAAEGDMAAADVAALEAMVPENTDPDDQAWIVRATKPR